MTNTSDPPNQTSLMQFLRDLTMVDDKGSRYGYDMSWTMIAKRASEELCALQRSPESDVPIGSEQVQFSSKLNLSGDSGRLIDKLATAQPIEVGSIAYLRADMVGDIVRQHFGEKP